MEQIVVNPKTTNKNNDKYPKTALFHMSSQNKQTNK